MFRYFAPFTSKWNFSSNNMLQHTSTMVLNLGLVLEKFSGRSTVPEYSWKFEIRAGSNRLYSRFDPVLQNSGFLVHSKFSDFRSELNLELTRYLPTKITPHPTGSGNGTGTGTGVPGVWLCTTGMDQIFAEFMLGQQNWVHVRRSGSAVQDPNSMAYGTQYRWSTDPASKGHRFRWIIRNTGRD